MGALSITYTQRTRSIADGAYPEDPLRYSCHGQTGQPLLHSRGSNWLMDLSYGQIEWIGQFIASGEADGTRKTMHASREGKTVEISVPLADDGTRMHLRHSVAQWQQLAADAELLAAGRAIETLPRYPHDAQLAAPKAGPGLRTLLHRER